MKQSYLFFLASFVAMTVSSLTVHSQTSDVNPQFEEPLLITNDRDIINLSGDVVAQLDCEVLFFGDFYIVRKTYYEPSRDAYPSRKEIVALADTTGNIVSQCYYDLTPYSVDNIIAKNLDNKYGVINIKDEIVIPFIYDSIEFRNGYYRVDKDSQTFFIDTSGKMNLSLSSFKDEGTSVRFFNDERAIVKHDDLFGVIDKAGKQIVPFQYQYIDNYSEGLARVEKEWRVKSGYIDKSGKLVIPCIYEWGEDFSGGLAMVELEGKMGFINKAGKPVSEFCYSYVESTFDSITGLRRVKKDNRFGFINKSGKLLIPCIYDDADDFSEGYAVVGKNKKYGLIDKTGEIVIPCIYDQVERVSNGLSIISINGKKGCFDTNNGTFVILCEYDDIELDGPKGTITIKKDGKSGLADRTKVLLPCSYGSVVDYLKLDDRLLFSVYDNYKSGVVDQDGNIIIPFKENNSIRFCTKALFNLAKIKITTDALIISK